MDAASWTVLGVGVTILIAIGVSFRSLRAELRSQSGRIDAQGEDLRNRIDAQGEDLRSRIDGQGEDLRNRIDAQGEVLRSGMGQLRERMAHLEGLLEGLREAITKRVA